VHIDNDFFFLYCIIIIFFFFIYIFYFIFLFLFLFFLFNYLISFILFFFTLIDNKKKKKKIFFFIHTILISAREIQKPSLLTFIWFSKRHQREVSRKPRINHMVVTCDVCILPFH
jgi:hypothetical protein